MGNDKQIKKDLTKAGSRFLPEEIANVDGGAEVYSLETEFEKTPAMNLSLINYRLRLTSCLRPRHRVVLTGKR